MWKKQKEIDKYTLNIIFFAKISLLVCPWWFEILVIFISTFDIYSFLFVIIITEVN